MRLLCCLAILGGLVWGGGCAWAETPAKFFTYSANNGSLPPPYHWQMTAEVDADGAGTLSYCQGYDTAGCGRATFKISDAAKAAVLAAAKTADLMGHPIKALTEPPVGGGVTQGMIVLDGVAYEITAFPVAEDQSRASAVLTAIAAAIPAEALAAAKAGAQPAE